MLIVFCIFLSAINFYFLVKILSEKPYQKDIQDFQTQTERLMVEFNRITTRNIDLLDSRIEELNHKIRQSQKTEALLKELFEEAQKIEHLSSIIPRHSSVRQLPVSTNTDDDISAQNQESSSSSPIVDEYLSDNPSLEELYSVGQSSPVSVEDSLDSLTPPNNIVEVKESENQRSWADRRPPVSTVSTNTADNNSIEVEDGQLSDRQSPDSLFEGVSVNKIKKHRKKVKNSQELLKKYIQENKPKEELLEMGYNINEINLVSLLEKNTK